MHEQMHDQLIDEMEAAIAQVESELDSRETIRLREIRSHVTRLAEHDDTNRDVIKADCIRASRIVKGMLKKIDQGNVITLDFSTGISRSALNQVCKALILADEMLDMSYEVMEIKTYTSHLPPLTSCDL